MRAFALSNPRQLLILEKFYYSAEGGDLRVASVGLAQI
jgi:hypothetical protein